MPTIFTHPAVALGAKPWFRDAITTPVLIAGVFGTMVPDADVAGLGNGVAYGSMFGHRGFTHSIVFALLVSALLLPLTRAPRKLAAFAYIFLSTMSHGVLDAFTSGGRGVGFLAPFSNHRFFAPWRPIRVSPIGTTQRLLPVLTSELKWVWLPMVVVFVLGIIATRGRRTSLLSRLPPRG